MNERRKNYDVTNTVDVSQPKAPLPSPLKYLDQSYLKEALRELGGR